MLMALFSMVLIFGMPYLMENSSYKFQARVMLNTDTTTVDPETKAEFEEMQKSGPLATAGSNPAEKLQNFDLAGWMAGKTDTGGSTGRNSQNPQAKKRA